MRNLLSDVTRFVPTNVKMHKKSDTVKHLSSEYGRHGSRDGIAGHSKRQKGIYNIKILEIRPKINTRSSYF